jgi:hypothetical protein
VVLETNCATDEGSLRALVSEVEAVAAGTGMRWALEYTVTYGFTLTCLLLEVGFDVYQAVRPNQKICRSGKTEKGRLNRGWWPLG